MGAEIDVIEEVATPEVPLEYLEREICQLASNNAAATCRWLLLLAEFRPAGGVGGVGRPLVCRVAAGAVESDASLPVTICGWRIAWRS
ncbi:MAG TPA: hypothetical protein VM142_15030 [Acidimicrobiales bacterium]|nr:hypothetical protein [Acidimicrobiales bacterium]